MMGRETVREIHQIKKVHIVSHTHWDREWYQDYQSFRVRMVYLIDELLEVMERDETYRFFTLDGQAIIVDDYLEIRPENKKRLLTLIRQGRIITGPWYVMPDEFLVSGEALIRNLLMGTRKVREWGGEPLKSGYVPDIFGHNSQLPQILRGFGIDHAVLFRGFQGEKQASEIIWRGSDGSNVLGLKLDEDRSYGDFFFFIRWPFADKDYHYDQEQLIERAQEMKVYKSERATTPIALGLDGVDHVEIEPMLPSIINTLNEDAGLNVYFEHSHLAAYVAELQPHLHDLEVYQGEQRSPGKVGLNNMVLANVLSSRYPIKRQNKECEALLEVWAEPWGVFAALEGRPYPKGFLEKAWRYLLQNHPHDSICGCSIDQVHRDMVYRFDQSRLIGEQMLKEQFAYISNHVFLSGGADDRHFVVFNSTQSHTDGVIVVEVWLPPQGSMNNSGPALGQSSFRLFDENGEVIPYQVHDYQKNVTTKWRPYRDLPSGGKADLYLLAFRTTIPALGYRTYAVKLQSAVELKAGEYTSATLKPPARFTGSQQVSSQSWDNGCYLLTVHTNGTLTILVHKTHKLFEHLLQFEDDGDIGEGWNHVAPAINQVCSSAGLHAEISVMSDGPLQTVIKIRQILNIPEAIHHSEVKRSEKLTKMVLETTLDVRDQDPLLRCRTRIVNTARDHRVRLLLPTGVQTEHFYTSTPFDLVKRPIKQPDYQDYLEHAREVVPHNGIICIHDDEVGIAILSKGLYEAAVRYDSLHTIAMTLFRSTGKEVLCDGSDGGQLLGELIFDYGISVYNPSEPIAELLYHELQRFVHPPRSVTLNSTKRVFETPHRRESNLPRMKSFLSISHRSLILSALKRSEDHEDHYIVRLVNVADEQVEGTLRFDRELSHVNQVHLDESLIGELNCIGKEVSVYAGPKQVITIEIVFKS